MSSIPGIDTPRIPTIIPRLNPLIRGVLGAGIPFGPNVLLTVRGRRTGQPRTFPVAIVQIGDRRFVQSPFGEVNWVRNLRADGQAVVTRGNRRELVDTRELSADEAGPLLRAALEPYQRSRILAPIVRRFFAIGPGATTDDYVAEARRHPMFELLGRSAPATGVDQGETPAP